MGDEDLGGLVRVCSAIAKDGAFFERLVCICAWFKRQGYPEIGNGEMAILREEDVRRL